MTSDEAEDLLDRLGIEICGVNGYEIQAKCPAHVERTGHEDHNPSWWFNSDTGAHICFSCQFKGNEACRLGRQSVFQQRRGGDGL